MPNTNSAKKNIRKSKKRAIHNLTYKNRIKYLFKKIKKLISEKKKKEATELLPQIYKALDKAAKVGVIKKNTAARKKSLATRIVLKLVNQ